MHCLINNKEARGLAKQFPTLQSLIGMSREERRERARARRRQTKMKSVLKMKRGSKRRSSKHKGHHRHRHHEHRKRSGTLNLDMLDDVKAAADAADGGEDAMQVRVGTS